MDDLKVLNDNFGAENNSFLYYLHEENFLMKQRFPNCVAAYPLYAIPIRTIKWFLLKFALYMGKC